MKSKKQIMKIMSIIRLFVLILGMTFFVTIWKLGYNNTFFVNWAKTWIIVFVLVLILMCFIVSPFVLDKFSFQGKKRHLVGMFILTFVFAFVFAFVFSYRFDNMSQFGIQYINT